MYQRKRLTQITIDRLQPPKQGRLEIADDIVRGLVLRVTRRRAVEGAAPRRTWCVFWKVRDPATGRKVGQRRRTLGDMSLQAARDRAREILGDVDAGRLDPLARGFRDVAERYIATEAARLSPKTISEIKGTFENHLYPSWGTEALHAISSADLTLMLDQKSVGTAREIRKYVSGLYSWAIARGLAERNPVAALDTKTRRRLAYPDNHGRALTDAEVRSLWNAAAAMGYPYGTFYQLLILTGQRPYEWRDARWSEIQDGVLVIPRERFKTRRRSHSIPLVPAVTEILAAIPRDSCCDWLFHKRGACGPINGQSKRDVDLAKRAKVENFTVYDFRKTCATRLASLGVDPFLIDQVQSRSLTPLQRTYIRHDYAAEKRAVMQKYADHVLQLLAATPRGAGGTSA